jgi:hypothetical protein
VRGVFGVSGVMGDEGVYGVEGEGGLEGGPLGELASGTPTAPVDSEPLRPLSFVSSLAPDT